MPKKILYVTATSVEAGALQNVSGIIRGNKTYIYQDLEISLLIAGIGPVTTAWSMMHWLAGNTRPDLAINAGIAGSFRDEIIKGDVVMPVTECFADSGVEDNNMIRTLAEEGLADPDEFPFSGGYIHADPSYARRFLSDIRGVRAITSGIATGSGKTRDRLLKKFNPDIETMEGASFFYICCRESIPFMALRAVSNHVGPRNRKDWNIELALENLAGKLNDVLLKLD